MLIADLSIFTRLAQEEQEQINGAALAVAAAAATGDSATAAAASSTESSGGIARGAIIPTIASRGESTTLQLNAPLSSASV
ncbi:MAG: hypothetical protein BRC36_12250 [Cyanobacteria bacterium QH_2_48_84]|jgi:hypothetical protein|nr:MAG: hypothetical protein BRC36_12250 [Cyanobacteria bacterium QH_2_48_84]